MAQNRPNSFATGIASLKWVRSELEWLELSLAEAAVTDLELEWFSRVHLCLEAIEALCEWPWAMKLSSFLNENKLPKSTYHYLLKNSLITPPPMMKFGRTGYVLLGEAYPWLCSIGPIGVVNDDDGQPN
jgi:hypothetical protein